MTLFMDNFDQDDAAQALLAIQFEARRRWTLALDEDPLPGSSRRS